MKKKVLCLILALALCAGLAVPALAADEWKLTNSAYYSDEEDCYVLTDDKQQVYGGIWLDDFFYSNFILEFDYFTGINPTHGIVGFDPTGADGIRISFFLPDGYTLSDAEKNMGAGGSIGYFDLGFGIELDTFYNPEKNDPMAANHIALMKDGADNHLVSAALTESEDADWHHVKIVVEGNTCNVYVDEINKLTYQDIKSTACGLLGISAATGDDTNKHAVKNITYEGSGEPEAKPELPSPTPVSAAITAKPTASTVYVDGGAKAFEAYTIEGNNYFKLRDLAAVLNGSGKQFAVGYDNATKAITLSSGQSYVAVGGEMTPGDGKEKAAAPTASKIFLDGKELNLTVYTINNNNFFKLRDLMEAIDVYVGYDNATKAITLDTSKGYTPE